MNRDELTQPAVLAIVDRDKERTAVMGQYGGRYEEASGRRGLGAECGPVAMRGLVAMVSGCVALAGCVTVNAPAKPIVIELNINIKQEVVYRLSGEAAKTIDENKGIF